MDSDPKSPPKTSPWALLWGWFWAVILGQNPPTPLSRQVNYSYYTGKMYCKLINSWLPKILSIFRRIYIYLIFMRPPTTLQNGSFHSHTFLRFCFLFSSVLVLLWTLVHTGSICLQAIVTWYQFKKVKNIFSVLLKGPKGPLRRGLKAQQPSTGAIRRRL